MRYLIPMASESPLFPKEEFHFPKPLIEINGQPMIGLVIDHIKSHDENAEFVFVINRKDVIEYSLNASLRLLAGDDCVIIELANQTMGAVCSALMAVEHIDNEEPLVICNGDQLIEAELAEIAKNFIASGVDAGVVTFDSVHPRWSYAKLNSQGNVIETAEKRVLSRSAIAGYYYYKTGSAFVKAAKKYLLKSDPIGGIYYLSPTLNEIILAGGTIGNQTVSSSAYTSFYSPQRVEFFQNKSR